MTRKTRRGKPRYDSQVLKQLDSYAATLGVKVLGAHGVTAANLYDACDMVAEFAQMVEDCDMVAVDMPISPETGIFLCLIRYPQKFGRGQ